MDNVNDVIKNMSYSDRLEICSLYCDLYSSDKCELPCRDECEYISDCYKEYAKSQIAKKMDGKKLSEMSAKELFFVCTNAKLVVKCGMDRDYYVKKILDGGYDIMSIDEKVSEDVVRNPNHYRHGTFEVIDEMVIVFGMAKTIAFCQLNAWKYRARAPYKNKFDEDMAKANRYLEMAYELQQIRQEYPEADGYEACAFLKRICRNNNKEK